MPDFECHVCRTRLLVEQAQAGQLIRCPFCRTVQRAPMRSGESPGRVIPQAPPSPPSSRQSPPPPPPLSSTSPSVSTVDPAAAVETAAPSISASTATANPPPIPRRALPGLPAASGRRYGFACPHCSSPLEAHASMAAREGQCPTCGNTITIPILDRYNRLIDPVTKEIIKQDPHPVHAYAAAGHHAPRILRGSGGVQQIQCTRCSMVSPISANNCAGCGMPFTMEGTTADADNNTNGFCVAALVLGIVSLPGSCTVLPDLLAITFGIIGLYQISHSQVARGGKGMAIAGIVLGCMALGLALVYYLNA